MQTVGMSDLVAPARQLARWAVNHGLPSLALRRAARRGDLQGQLDTRLAVALGVALRYESEG